MYVNSKNISLMSQIKRSVFETNCILVKKKPTLIEYATFYGSIQIVQYLKYNNVPFEPSLWIYAIHSNNPEIIHLIEENVNVNDFEINLNEILKESIECHHNEISKYINDNLLSSKKYKEFDYNEFNDYFDPCIINSCNIIFFPNKIDTIISRKRKENGFHLSMLCFSLKQITIPSSVTLIGNEAFKNCSLLTKITIPSSVKSIGEYAFLGCYSLNEITIPSSITKIESNAFSNCSSLKQIKIPSSISEIKDYTFYGCYSLTQILIPSSVTSIGKYSFSGCSSLVDITIPTSVLKIGSNAFNRCSSLIKITIPSSVKIIEESSFSWCTSLIQIELPSSLNFIENYLFNGCSSLEKIKIPSSVTSFGEGSFCGCSSLKEITIPQSQEFIPNFLFSFCYSLKSIEIPSAVKFIGDYAFFDCRSLCDIKMSSSLTKIGIDSFTGCQALENLPSLSFNENETVNLNIDDYKITQSFISCYGESFKGINYKTKKEVFIKTYHESFFKSITDFKKMVYCTCVNIPGFVKINSYRFPIIDTKIININKERHDFSYYITVSDFVKYGDISNMTKEYLNEKGTKNTIMNPTIRSKIIFGVAAIMKQLHAKKIIHRDFKISKVLLDDHFEPIISSSKYTKIVTDEDEFECILFTLYNMAPEMQKNDDDNYSFPVDVYAYAFFLYKMFSNEILIDGSRSFDSNRFRRAIFIGKRPDKPDDIPDHYWKLIQMCWKHYPDERPTFENIVEILKDDKYSLEEFGMKTDLHELHEYRKCMTFENNLTS